MIEKLGLVPRPGNSSQNILPKSIGSEIVTLESSPGLTPGDNKSIINFIAPNMSHFSKYPLTTSMATDKLTSPPGIVSNDSLALDANTLNKKQIKQKYARVASREESCVGF